MQAQLYKAISGKDAESDAAARNFFLHGISLTLTKVADGLLDPKIVLSWLMSALGAPAAMVGFLVPIREAGALAPQLLIAPFVRAARIRKWFWAIGSVGQGLCVVGIGMAALSLEGVAAGGVILALLAAFSLCRAVCSTSYKDVLGKTVEPSTRGAITGAAASLAAGGTLLFGGLLAVGVIPHTVIAISIIILVAGSVWVLAGLIFTRVAEEDSETDNGTGISAAGLFTPLAKDAQLRRFIAARALLVPTALAPPFLIALSASEGGKEMGALGPFIIASAAASILSGYIWGRFSDRSSRMTFVFSGGIAAIILAVAGAMALGGSVSLALAVGLLFVAQIAYEGVRSARKIHLVDMAAENDRAVYTALSNTLIGGVLILGGGLGVISQAFGVSAALGLSAALCAAGAAVALGLDEVQS